MIDKNNTPLMGYFYINEQGEDSIETKLNRNIKIGEVVLLIRDIPNLHLYKGYRCAISGIEHGEEGIYDIEFYSTFKDGDPSFKSLEANPDFCFPDSSITYTVSSKDFVRLETQDFIYKTHF